MNVQHFMTEHPVTCEATDTCSYAAQLMRDNGVGSVVVLRNGRLAGIVTDRQLAINCLASGSDHKQEEVGRFMTANPAFCTLEDNIFSVIDTMRSAGVVERVPVVTAEREVLGIVSVSDVAVVAKDLIDHILLNETHHSLNEARLFTGGKRMVKRIRRPTKLARLPRTEAPRPTRRRTLPGPPARTGRPRIEPRARTSRAAARPKTAKGGVRRRLSTRLRQARQAMRHAT